LLNLGAEPNILLENNLQNTPKLFVQNLGNKYSHGEEKLLCRRQGKRGNSFALVNYRKCCQEQTAVCSAGTDIFENRLCPYHNGEEL